VLLCRDEIGGQRLGDLGLGALAEHDPRQLADRPGKQPLHIEEHPEVEVCERMLNVLGKIEREEDPEGGGIFEVGPPSCG
jgi:hypothetical protein